VVFSISCGNRALRIRDRSPEQCYNYCSLHGILLGSRERGTAERGQSIAIPRIMQTLR
jgi:hypothetical protein